MVTCSSSDGSIHTYIQSMVSVDINSIGERKHDVFGIHMFVDMISRSVWSTIISADSCEIGLDSNGVSTFQLGDGEFFPLPGSISNKLVDCVKLNKPYETT